jgi:hypothetical protein
MALNSTALVPIVAVKVTLATFAGVTGDGVVVVVVVTTAVVVVVVGMGVVVVGMGVVVVGMGVVVVGMGVVVVGMEHTPLAWDQTVPFEQDVHIDLPSNE